MPFAEICYFVVCLTLNECSNYASQLNTGAGAPLAETRIDSFYWRNPAGLTVDPSTQHSLYSLMSSTPELHHWRFTDPSAMHWLPYYHYYNNPPTDRTCSAFVKLDPDLLFAQAETDYRSLFAEVVASLGATLYTGLEAACQTGLGTENAHVVGNLDRYYLALSGFQETAHSQFYVRGMLDAYLQQLEHQQSLPALDLTDCVSTSTTLTLWPSSVLTRPDTSMFLRLQLNFPDNADMDLKAEGVAAVPSTGGLRKSLF